MNELLKNLKEQSMTVLNRGDGYYDYVLDEEKFAKLIVQECANLFEDDGTASSMREYLCNNAAKETILKHFGVEK